MQEHIVIGTIAIAKNDEQIEFKFSPSASFAQLKNKSKASLLLDFSLFLAELSQDSNFINLKGGAKWKSQ